MNCKYEKDFIYFNTKACLSIQHGTEKHASKAKQKGAKEAKAWKVEVAVVMESLW